MIYTNHNNNETNSSLVIEVDDGSVDSNFIDPELLTITSPGTKADDLAVKATLESEKYDADTIRKEFKTYQSLLPQPDVLLQEKPSFQQLRDLMLEKDVEAPRFLRFKHETGGIKPHHALCCLLLSEFEAKKQQKLSTRRYGQLLAFPARLLTCGYLYRQLNNPAEFMRDQFNRVAHAVPMDVVKPHVLRKKIQNHGLPVPNYFLDPEDDKQFPPHIALLVILQDGEKESKKLDSILNEIFFSIFAFVALILRIVLEVIGGAGAVWGGSEVFKLRYSETQEMWRWISVAIGILCLFRFITLNIPQKEDEGDILGPAGPWSLRLPVRLRAITEHPFHYFVRALPPSDPSKTKKCL